MSRIFAREVFFKGCVKTASLRHRYPQLEKSVNLLEMQPSCFCFNMSLGLIMSGLDIDLLPR